MKSCKVLNSPSADELQLIYKELGVEEVKIKNNVMLLKEWLRSEAHLPNNLDENLLENFLRGCKGNLEKTKLKLEKYLAAKTKLTHIFHTGAIVDEDYLQYLVHRCTFVSSKYTKNGNRVIIFRLPTSDATHFDFFKCSKYVLLMLDFLLQYDTTAGYEFIYESENVSGQVFAKLNLAATKHIFNLLYNIIPIRTRSIFVLNPNTFIEVIMTIAKSLMPAKIKERIRNGTMEQLMKHFPKDCLPIEYGGTGESLNAQCDKSLRLFKENKDWCISAGQNKLIGPLPEHKKKQYSFEDFNMDGSFRQLSID